MGEKEEEKKEEVERKEDKKDGEKKEEKKDDEPPEIVLKVDMHCEACARKVARALKGFEGVEEVRTDSKGSKVIVRGKTADPVKVYERLQKKSGRKVELIAPLPKPPDENKDPKDEVKEEKKEEEKKEEPPTPIMVKLKVRMHCEACAQVLQKRIRKFKGVESVETDHTNNQVIVKGIIDPAKLVDEVYKKMKKRASIVPEEKEVENKEEEKKESAPKDEKKEGEDAKEDDDKKMDIKKSEYWSSRYYLENTFNYPPPQMFSDENPNACSIM